MSFWLLAGGLILVTLAVLAVPLMRGGRKETPRAEHDLAVYRDQLSEVERDRDRGLLTPDEAEAARHEVERRLLAAAADRPEATSSHARGRSVTLAVLAVVVCGGSLGIYALLGAPGVPSLPHAARQAPNDGAPAMAQAVEQLAARLAEAPEDPRGWNLLGRSYAQLGRYREATNAFRQAILHGDDSATAQVNLGEMLVAAQNGVVGPESRQAFAAALQRDPAEPRARYYAGLAYAQDGLLTQALTVWQDLLRDSPPEAPWRDLLRQQIAALQTELGQSPAPTGPGPDQSDVAAAAAMSKAEREAFIQSMVDGLAARLEQTPDDLDGWLRLTRAYTVLGQRDQAEAALARATDLAQDLPANAPAHGAIAAARDQLDSMP